MKVSLQQLQQQPQIHLLDARASQKLKGGDADFIIEEEMVGGA